MKPMDKLDTEIKETTSNLPLLQLEKAPLPEPGIILGWLR